MKFHGTRDSGLGTRESGSALPVSSASNVMHGGDRKAGRHAERPIESRVPSSESPQAVLIMAGGTGGHIFPGLAVAEVLRTRGIPVAWLGSAGAMETRLVPQHGIALDTITVTGLRGKGWSRQLKAPWMLLRALLQAWRVLRRVRPRSVLSMGGFAAGPGGMVAWLQGRPLLVHEQNRVAGLTNRVLAHLARRVMTGFADCLADHPRHEWTGNPVRADIAALEEPQQRMAGRAGPVRILVLGGSLGARALNTALPAVLASALPENRPAIWHQSGARGLSEALDAYADAGVEARVDAFIDDMAAAYAWADLCVCRAGALTIAELCAAGLGALLVPFPHAVDDHQTRNAEALRDAGGAQIVAEADLGDPALIATLQTLLNDRSRLLAMAGAARQLARPDAAERIAGLCVEEAA